MRSFVENRRPVIRSRASSLFAFLSLFTSIGTLLCCRWAPRLRAGGCDAASATACGHAARLSRALLWISTALFCVGFFVAFLLGPILARWS